MNTFRVKNFETFQHYKDRAPPWIKLYNEVLDDYDFGALPDASKFHLIAIWLLASRSNNKIPYDAGWIERRINATGKVDLALLVERGFILLDQPLQGVEQDASEMLAKCLSREEGERENIEQKNIRAVAKATRPNADFEEFWEARPRRKGADPKDPARKLYEIAAKTVPPAELLSALKRYAAIESEHVSTPYLPQMVKWLRDKRWCDYPEITVQETKGTDWDAICISFKKFGHWSKQGGNHPESGSCRCPPEILARHGISFASLTVEPLAIPALRIVQ